ncbi:sigma-70 family RNA polymerase sigma factor [Clostridium sp. YIM B02551]|uniref:sigma-70 family RNA polymerase sigma factor n=1 Tax=Clostridium sp. YIM B02551 TaxID=2910679 RepID=UPI001EEA6BE9|nr:sigma-70 family RNA polymerase sigma factor [Clostridium sp. YIM B02551]
MENFIELNVKETNKNALELKLIKKAVKGDSSAFIEAMKVYKGYLYRTAYAYVKSEESALEVLHECTYNAFLNIKTLRNPQYFKTWITRILINAAIKYLRRNENISYIDDTMVLKEPTSNISIEEKLDLYDAIDLLRENYKTVIILKYFNDLSIEEISSIMDIPQNTVKTYLRRSKDNLSKILMEGYLDD